MSVDLAQAFQDALHTSGTIAPEGHDLIQDDRLDGCCMGAAAQGRSRCTCWVPLYPEGQETAQEGPMSLRRKCCADCAYRQGSPERESGELDSHGPGRIFACHQGMRRVRAWLHEPTGYLLPAGDGDYQPPNGNRYPLHRLDGSPGEVCAGYALVVGA